MRSILGAIALLAACGAPSVKSPPRGVARAAITRDFAVEHAGATGRLLAVWGSGDGDVYASGDDGVFHSSGDGSWAQLVGQGAASWSAIWGSSADDIYIGGYADCDPGRGHSCVWFWMHVGPGGVASAPAELPYSSYALKVTGAGGTGPDDVHFAAGTYLVHTSDGGASWQKLEPAPETYALAGFTGSDYVATGGAPATILQSDDQGASWYTIASLPAGCVAMRLASTADALGLIGLVRPDSYGGTYQLLTFDPDGNPQLAPAPGVLTSCCSEPSQNLRDLTATADAIFVVGDGGKLARTEDGGATWTATPLATSVDLRGAWASPSGDLYAVGTGGTIVHGRPAP